MTTIETAGPANLGETGKPHGSPLKTGGFGLLSFTELQECVPLSERTLREAIKRGYIPAIRLPGARRLLFDPDAVRAALQRFARGGAA